MRLEPVYLVAPKPRPPSMPTRRAFLGMGLAFAVGGAIGSACGYSVGSAKAAEKAGGGPAGEDYPLSGNPELDELRRLAVKAPIEELMGIAMVFIRTVTQDYPEEVVAWKGVRRMGEHVLANPGVAQRRVIARFLCQGIEQASSQRQESLNDLLPRLREIR